MVYYTERIKEVRTYRDMTQQAVAEKIGIKREQYRRYEKGINEMPVSKFIKVCEVFKVSSDYLLGLSNEFKTYERR